jgi:hypothetical protein
MAGGFTQLSVNSGDGAAPPLGDTLDCPLVPGHKPRWPYCKGLHARLASHKVGWQPPQDEQLDGLGDPPVQGQVCRPPIQKPRDGSTNLLTPRTECPSLLQHLLGKHQRASAREWIGWAETPPPKAWIIGWPPRCARSLQSASPHAGGQRWSTSYGDTLLITLEA